MFKLYKYYCNAVFWKLRRRQIVEILLGLARVDGIDTNILSKIFQTLKLVNDICPLLSR